MLFFLGGRSEWQFENNKNNSQTKLADAENKLVLEQEKLSKYEESYNEDKGYNHLHMSKNFKPFETKVKEFINKILGKK